MKLYEIVEQNGILPINSNDIDEVIDLCIAEFGSHDAGGAAETSAFVKSYTDWSVSKKLVINGKLAGFMLLRPRPIKELLDESKVSELFVDLSIFDNKSGVEGVALVVVPEHRGSMSAAKLTRLPQRLGYDYAYGQALKSLGNIQFWLKRSVLVADLGDTWVAASIF